MARGSANKAQTARRVIEVFEYFDDQVRHATVMDIVRRYKRPQSSTSELMASLVEMGLLYKDPASRSYTPTPRAAVLGARAQPSLVRDGSLWTMIDRLAQDVGHGVVLMGMVGLTVQIFHRVAGAKPLNSSLSGGSQGRLTESAAGLLLLSTLSPDRRDGILRRLNAEAPAEQKFNYAAKKEAVEACARQGYASGESGFGATANMCAVLLPIEAGEPPLALGIVYDPPEALDDVLLASRLRHAVQTCGQTSGAPANRDGASQESLSSAA